MEALLLLLLPAAACGVMMVGCMWLMRRGMSGHQPDDHGDTPSSGGELAALRDEVTRLRSQQAPTVEPHAAATEADDTKETR